MKWFGWFRKKEERPCQCGHLKCYHDTSVNMCMISRPWCSCAKYIPVAEPEVPKDVKELERMMKL